MVFLAGKWAHLSANPPPSMALSPAHSCKGSFRHGGDALAEINSTRADGEGKKNLLATDLEFAKNKTGVGG